MALKDEVLILAPQLSTLPVSMLDKVTERVAVKLEATLFGADIEEAREYMAAHQLSLLQRALSTHGAGGSVASMGSSRQNISFSNLATTAGLEYLNQTAYGQHLISLMKESIVPVMTVQPGS